MANGEKEGPEVSPPQETARQDPVEKARIQGRAEMAHEIRQPVGVVRNLTYLLRSNADDPEKRRKYLEMLEREIQRLNIIIEDNLTMGREPKPMPEEVDINQFIEEFAERFPSKPGITIETEPGKVPTILTDRTHLGQVIDNLARNALEAMEEKGGTLTLSTERLGDEVAIRVQDTGTGIAPEDLKSIFEPMFTKGKSGGTGLGLAIVKELVEVNRGRVEVESEVGRGTTFTVLLPAEA